jgi:hypothetical protein
MMFDPSALRRLPALLALVLTCVVVLSGCNRGPKMVQVSGKVLYKDGTVPKGGVCVVNFTPTKESTAEVRKGASGSIGPDGSFSLTTRSPNDGVYVGEYAVSFVVWPGPMDPRSLVMPKYGSAMMTPYKEKIEQSRDDLKYEIEPAPGVTGVAAGSAPAAEAGSKPAGN